MSGFTSAQTGDFDKYFMTTTELIDRYAIGGLWGWGNDSYGRLGDNSIATKSSPVQTVALGTNWKQVAPRMYQHSAIIKTDGTLWVCGYNVDGELGDSTRTHRSSPVQVVGSTNTWKQVACGNFHTAAIKTDGTMWAWGFNSTGQIGDSTVTNKSAPSQVIGSDNNWKQVAGGQYFTAGLKTDGTLWMWGDNYYGQLGDSSISHRSVPVQVVGSTNTWKQVACGLNHTAALKTDGTLWTWGYNFDGELGDNTSVTYRNSPVQTAAGGSNWKQVACGEWHCSAIKTNGTLWSWGYNLDGELGDSTRITKSSPVQTISGGTNWKQVACGHYHTSGIKTDGTLWIWGYNSNAQLGDSTVDSKSSPIQTIAGGNNWKQVGLGAFHSMGIQYSDIGQIL